MEKEIYVYAGIKSCGCLVAACVDRPEYKNDTAKFVAGLIKDGLQVKRIKGGVTIQRCKCGVTEELFKEAK